LNPVRYVPGVKRAIDLLGAAGGLFLLSPLLAACAAVVRLHLGAPVFFRQRRPGQHGTLFTIYKFRTMRELTDAHGHPLPDAERLTRAGRIMRSFSLDELPELWNVLRGDMSLVGPRPLLPQYLSRYSDEQARRHELRPGITGWAQVNGRNAVSWEEKFRLDVWYVEHCSLRLDLKIMLMTLTKVLLRRGISEAGHATAREFTGSSRQ
jgi:lipopolysaccharide/colanic/teichoic acid biosynthesis glycosyltransferase